MFSEKGEALNNVHLPVLFSVGCNLEGMETFHVPSKEHKELTSKLLGTQLNMADKKYRAAVEQCKYIFEQMDELMQIESDHLSEMNGDMVTGANVLDGGDYDLEMDENGGVSSKHMKSLRNLFEKFEGYCNELAVFGLNSAGYDVKLIKKFLFK